MKNFSVVFLVSTSLFGAIAITQNVQAQVYLTSSGQTSFFSKTPAEDISAVNKTTSSIINGRNDSIVVRIKNLSFDFPNSLMKDHFNENYMESEKYPYSTFKGKITPHLDFTKDGAYPVTATGKLMIHGVEREVTLQGNASVKGEEVKLSAEFLVKTADYHIEIPKLVFQKIAESIKVNFDATYKPLKK
jgi:hypothetical protein